MPKKLTQDDKRVLTTGQEDFDFVISGAWKRIKQKLLNKMVMNDSLSSIELKGRSDEELVREIAGRAHASALVFEWISAVEGDAAIHKEARAAMQEVREEIYFNNSQRSDEELMHNE